MTTTVPLSRNRNYTILWTSQALAEVGFSATSFAFPLLALLITGSPVVAGAVVAVESLGQVLVGLPAGALVDRWDRKKVMVWCEAAQAVSLGSLVAVLFWGTVTVPHLVVVAAVMGICRALFEPAEDACLPNLVAESQLSTAIGLNAARSALGDSGGKALGGVLYGLNRAFPFLLDMITHIIGFFALLFLRVPPRERVKPENPHLGREIAEGLRWVWQRKEIRVTTICAAVLNMFFAGFYLVVLVLANGRGIPEAELGFMAAMLGVGGIVGSLLAPTLCERLSPYLSIVGVFWGVTLLTPLTLLFDNGYLIGVLFGLMALLAPTANTTISTHQMLITPDELRGRLGSVLTLVVGAAFGIGSLAGGQLAASLPPTAAVLTCTGGIAAVTLLVTLNPTLRRYPANHPEQP
ncbi:MFS transporter [Allokutzneria sp. NRRL B-24872]|uniref:MFS transporter n=1 Tax=Allokutzneria sp. NRRL B-24872 TaxID=1137961 RepID=UPI000A3B72B3|nr:MFS transporter [Allokutzneria sp. NRRL B-24872]